VEEVVAGGSAEGNVLWASEELGLRAMPIYVPRTVEGWRCANCRRFMPNAFDAPGFFLAALGQ